ncbi:histidine kinase [Streptosporangium sp. NPDC000396]|uniref:histidine kinase n=1 Tax=Streptosporangium sp. NPDC000396 TaxID=3366185 RepID=UPI003699F880
MTDEQAVPGPDPADQHGHAQRSAADRERMAYALFDSLIHRLHAVSLHLHGALPHINDEHAATKVGHAIDELDQAIRHLHNAVLDIRQGPSGPDRGSEAEPT